MHIPGPRHFKNTTKIPREDTQRDRKRTKWEREMEKRERNFLGGRAEAVAVFGQPHFAQSIFVLCCGCSWCGLLESCLFGPNHTQRRTTTCTGPPLPTRTFQGPGAPNIHQHTRRHQRDRKRTKWSWESQTQRNFLECPGDGWSGEGWSRGVQTNNNTNTARNGGWRPNP